MSKQNALSQQGISLIEMLLIVAAISAGTAVAFIGAKQYQESGRVDEASLTLTILSKSIQNVSSFATDYSVLRVSPKNVIQANMFGDSGLLKPTKWGTLTLTTKASGANADAIYTIALAGLPPSACAKIIARNHTDFGSARVNGADAWTLGTGTPDPSALLNLCNQPDNFVEFDSVLLKAGIPPVVCTAPQVRNPATNTCITPPPGPTPTPGPSPTFTCSPPKVPDATGTICIIPPLVCTAPLVPDASGLVCVAAPPPAPPATMASGATWGYIYDGSSNLIGAPIAAFSNQVNGALANAACDGSLGPLGVVANNNPLTPYAENAAGPGPSYSYGNPAVIAGIYQSVASSMGISVVTGDTMLQLAATGNSSAAREAAVASSTNQIVIHAAPGFWAYGHDCPCGSPALAMGYTTTTRSCP